MKRSGPLSVVFLASVLGSLSSSPSPPCYRWGAAAFVVVTTGTAPVHRADRLWTRAGSSIALRTAPLLSSSSSSTLLAASSSTSSATSSLPSALLVTSAVDELKRVLEREYTSFFNPMEREWYSDRVTFEDPLTSLSGVDRYQSNVDMLSSRTLLGKFLFSDAGIVLHSVTGGSVRDVPTDGNGSSKVEIEDIVTRWTLRLTAKVLPWQPTARFSGISVYKVVPGGSRGVQIVQQTDYWDSINMKPGCGKNSGYQRVDKATALSDFLGQIQPGSFVAPSAGPELPYSLLRRGDGYEVRRYPAMVAVETNYERRDEGFLTLGSVTSGMNPLSPAIMTIQPGRPKSMSWPVAYAPPGSTTADPSVPAELVRRLKDDNDEYSGGDDDVVRTRNVPERVVAVRTFSDASVESVVRRCDTELRDLCQRDGLGVASTSSSSGVLQFAQYDAVYTMGKRRGEVWVELEEGTHPWSRPR